MKRLNLKLLVSLVVGLLVMVAGIWVVHGFQVQSNTASLRAEGDALLQEGKKSQALKKYDKYLQYNDGDIKVHLLASKIAVEIFDAAPSIPEKRAVASMVYEQLKKAQRALQQQSVEDAEFRQRLAEFLMKIGDYSGAREQFEWLTATSRGKHDPKFDLMLAACYRQQDKIKEAIKIFADMIGYDLDTYKFDSKRGTDPKENDPYIFMAEFLRERAEPPKPNEADAMMERLVAVNNNSGTAHLARASYLFKYGGADPIKREERKKLAKEELAQAEKIAPEEPKVIIFASMIAHDDKNYAKAEQILLRGLKLFPKDVGMYRQWAIIKVDEKKIDEARQKIAEGLKNLPDDQDLLWLSAEVDLQEHRLDTAKVTIKKLDELKYPRELLDLLEARILFLDGKWLEASQRYEKLRPLVANSRDHLLQADIFLAQCYEQLGQSDKQLEAARRVLQSDKNNVAALVSEASALNGLGRVNESRAKYELLGKMLYKADGSTPLPQQVWVPIIEMRIAEVMKLPKEQRNWTQVDALIGYLERSGSATDVATALLKSEVQFRKNDLDGAYKTLDASRKAHPDDPAVWSALATIVMQQKDKGPAEGLKLLDQVPEALRPNVTLKLNRAGMLIRQGGEIVKAAVLALDQDTDKLSLADRTRLWSGLGTALISTGDREGAIAFWTKVMDADASDLRIRFGLFDLARDEGDDGLMTKIMADMRKLMGKNSVEFQYLDAARNIALVQKSVRARTGATQQHVALDASERQQLSDARKLLNQVIQVRPGWYEALKVAGDADLLDGNMDGAINNYRLSLKNGPPNPSTIRTLVLLLSRLGRMSELPQLLIDVPSAGDFMPKMRVESLANQADFEAAIKLAIQEVPESSTDPYGHMWIGHLYERAAGKQPDNKNDAAQTSVTKENQAKWLQEAEKSYRRAVKLGPTLPETWLVLVDHLMARKLNKEAETVLMAARKELPEDRVNQVLGPGYEALGETLLAEQYYKAALEAAPKDMATHRLVAMFYLRSKKVADARREAAIVLRGSQGDPQTEAKNKPHLLWARRTLAEIMAEDGDLDSFNKARALLTANTKLNNEDNEDKIRLANLLARRYEEPALLREALKTFESVKSLGIEEQITVAKIHEALGDPALAREELLKLVSKPNAPVSAHLAFVEILVRNNQIPDAANRLDELDKIYPAAGLLLRTRVLVKQGKSDQALTLLGRILPPRPVKKEQASALRTVALVMDQIGLDSKAEELYREYMQHEPGLGSLQLAAFLGRAGRLDDALDLCEKAFTAQPGEDKPQPRHTVLQVIGEVLHAKPSRVEARHLQRVKGWYDKFLQEEPESIGLKLQYADFQITAGQDVEAERILREVLKRSDATTAEKAIAGNNLAVVLANQRKNLPEALELINNAGAGMGFTSDVLDTRGTVYLAMGKFSDAAADFRDSVLVTNPAPLKLLHLAYAEDRIGDRSAASAALRRAKDARLEAAALPKAEKAMYDQLVKDVGV